MPIWEADCYRRPLKDAAGNPLWEMLVCSADFSLTYSAIAPQQAVSQDWAVTQLKTVISQFGHRPEAIHVFRPQTLALLRPAATHLNLTVEATRYAPAIQRWAVERLSWYSTQPFYTGEDYHPLRLDRPAPVPLPENLWAEQWRFGGLTAQDFQESLIHEPIPVGSVREDWLPLSLGLASTSIIPGVILDAGRRAMRLAQWLDEQGPVALSYVPGAPDGLILEAGLVERWILTTFEDEQVQRAGQQFRDRQQAAVGLHFLLVRPDDSGMTFTGLWLLRLETPGDSFGGNA